MGNLYNIMFCLQDLGFIEKANRAYLEKLMGSMFLDAPGGGGDENHQTTVQTLELDGTTVTVDRVDPWHPTYDKGGRLEKKADLGAIMVSLFLFPSVRAIIMTGTCFVHYRAHPRNRGAWSSRSWPRGTSRRRTC